VVGSLAGSELVAVGQPPLTPPPYSEGWTGSGCQDLSEPTVRDKTEQSSNSSYLPPPLGKLSTDNFGRAASLANSGVTPSVEHRIGTNFQPPSLNTSQKVRKRGKDGFVPAMSFVVGER